MQLVKAAEANSEVRLQTEELIWLVLYDGLAKSVINEMLGTLWVNIVTTKPRAIQGLTYDVRGGEWGGVKIIHLPLWMAVA